MLKYVLKYKYWSFYDLLCTIYVVTLVVFTQAQIGHFCTFSSQPRVGTTNRSENNNPGLEVQQKIVGKSRIAMSSVPRDYELKVEQNMPRTISKCYTRLSLGDNTNIE